MFDVEKIRADFPLLSTEVYGRPLVYLDSGATAQKPRCVIDTVDYLHRELNANIHRGVHRLAEEATERYEAAMNGSPYSALLCLMVSGLLDAFDGRIARTKKNRTEQEKRFGIQIDSLNDVVCFGVLPGVIGASLGGGEWWLRASVLFYILAALIRLAYFNVTEEERQSATNEHRHYYLGVPVTAASFVMPLFWALPLRLGSALAVIYAVGLTLLAFLFIAPLRIPKPGLKGILCMILLGAAELYLMFYGVMPL